MRSRRTARRDLRPVRPRRAAVVPASLVVLAAGTPVAFAASDAGDPAIERAVAGRAVLSSGHVDVGPRFVDGRWRIRVRDERPDPPVLRDPADVVLRVPDTARLRLPDDPALRVLGRPGATAWALPQTQDPRLVWPGWSTEDPEVLRRLRGSVRWTLRAVTAPEGSGPRGFALLAASGFGAPEVLFAGSRPLPQSTAVRAGTHAHGTWTFPAPGAWALHVEMGATLRDGSRVTDRATLRFAVGPGDPRAAFAAGDDRGDGGPPVAALLGGSGVVVLVVAGLTLRSLRRRDREAAR